MACTLSEVPTIEEFECIFGNVVSIALEAASITFFVLLLVGGFKYLTAGGDPQKVQGASKTLTYAIGGLVLIVLSLLILRFISEFTGVDVTVFNVVVI